MSSCSTSSSGFVYEVLHDFAAGLDIAAHRCRVLEHFIGTLCVDELHLGRFTLLVTVHGPGTSEEQAVRAS